MKKCVLPQLPEASFKESFKPTSDIAICFAVPFAPYVTPSACVTPAPAVRRFFNGQRPCLNFAVDQKELVARPKAIGRKRVMSRIDFSEEVP